MDKFVDSLEGLTLHPKIAELSFPPLHQFQNLILYGPQGVGKYTQMLRIIQPYSPSHLKCEKKIVIESTPPHFIKISDIHYEVDMDMLGCNPKPLWNEIYTHIYDVIQSKYTEKNGIIICKNFHCINYELLDIFYSYMQSSIKFILITESISFIPSTITSRCKILCIPRPSRTVYEECLKVPIPTTIVNIKSILQHQPTIYFFKPICTKLTNAITTLDFTMSDLREELYNILIFNLQIEKICEHFLSIDVPLDIKKKMINETIHFLQFFNNNYRPIYHLERYIYSIMKIIHKL